MRTAVEIKKRYEKTLNEKSKFDTLYKDVYDYGMPSRFKDKDETSGQKKREKIYSSVFEQSCDEFVQRFQSLTAPVNSDWIDFDAGYIYDLEGQESGREEVSKKLSVLAKVCNTYKNTSSFDTVYTEFCYDLIAGTSCLLILEGTYDKPLIFSVIPFKELTMEDGVDGNIQAYYRKMNMKNELIQKQWKDAQLSFDDADKDKEVELIECTYYDYESDKWIYNVVYKDSIIVNRTYKNSPFVDLRWSKYAGETYGRGVGLKVIADVKTLNKIKEYSLRGLNYSLPILLASEEGDYDPSKFIPEPLAINPVPNTSNTSPTIRQLEIGQPVDIMQYNITQLEMDIKKAMYASTIPNDPSKMTATEVMRRIDELDNSLNNSFGRLLEFLYRFVKRIVEVLQSFAYIPLDFDMKQLDGYSYKIKINTNLARQQTAKDVKVVLEALQTFLSVDPSGMLIQKTIKLDKLTPYLAEKIGVPNEFIYTTQEIQQNQMAEAQSQQAQIDEMNANQVVMSNAIEKGKQDAKRSV